jgi:hypothetical protein
VGGDAPSIRAIDGAKKAQQKTQPASIVRAGAERFVPDWLKNQGKTFWDGFGDAFMAEANDALDGIKNAPEAIQEAWSAFLADPTGFVWDFVKAGLRDLGETLDLIQLRSNPRHPYEVGKDNGKLAFRALGFLGGAGLTGLAARAPKLLKLLKGKRKPKGTDRVPESTPLTQVVLKLSPYELKTTHSPTLSRKQLKDLKAAIENDGIQESIKYVEHDGARYVVDGHHRLLIAKQLGMKEVPVQQVQLPYSGYRTTQDLIYYGER